VEHREIWTSQICTKQKGRPHGACQGFGFYTFFSREPPFLPAALSLLHIQQPASQPASSSSNITASMEEGGCFFEDGIASSLIVSGAVLLRCEAVLGPLRCFFFYSTVFTSGCIPSAPCWPFIISY